MSMGPLVSGTSYVLCLSPLVLEMLQKESKLVIFLFPVLAQEALVLNTAQSEALEDCLLGPLLYLGTV